MSLQHGEVIIRGATLGDFVRNPLLVIIHILANTYSISRDDDLLGGMRAVVNLISQAS